MPDLKLLQDELTQVNSRQKAIRDKNPGQAVLPEEERKEDEALAERGRKITYLIEEEKQRLRDAEFSTRLSYENDPAYKIPHGVHVNDDDDGRKELNHHGWEIKDGWVSRMTSYGVERKLYAEKVLFGPIPKNPSGAEYVKTARASFQPGYRQAFFQFMQNFSITKDLGLSLNQLSPDEQKALSEGMDTAGGYLVPPDMQAELLVRAAQTAVMRRLATVRQTSRDVYVHNRVQAHATSGSIYSSNFVATWVGETPSQGDTDPVFGRFEIPIRKLRLITKISNDVLADSITNIPAFLSEDGGRNMALAEDQGFIAGVAPLGPLGLLNDPDVSTVDVEGSTANTISNTVSATGSAPKILNLAYAVPSQYAEGASWVMRRRIEGLVAGLVDANGRFLWPILSGSGFAPGPRVLEGKSVYNSDFVPNDGADTNRVFIFGDLSAYYIAERAQITMRVLNERYADNDQTGFVLFERVGGALTNPDAVRFGVV